MFSTSSISGSGGAAAIMEQGLGGSKVGRAQASLLALVGRGVVDHGNSQVCLAGMLLKEEEMENSLGAKRGQASRNHSNVGVAVLKSASTSSTVRPSFWLYLYRSSLPSAVAK
eukprot:CAMPEP_0202360186 /NCGR_PEP_ID=MMETSP1126-20121109/13215_1 /ASSEMBLY_ACC=CAM_ASM_000457 /TAXON_ID=3047 /ORGANISM="Dunaliella tertiolecta, Strain CCMP1320" /LENGTH=112 /DNA_ID=CAMNT_0048953819 /DNA_START=95 /DNA_END=434 /DNA_ORIENTATION=+